MWLYFFKPLLESYYFQLKALLIHTDWLAIFTPLDSHRKGETFLRVELLLNVSSPKPL